MNRDSIKKIIKMSMAYNRQIFVQKIEEKIVGAIKEFYKSELAILNKQTKWTLHWKNESKRLIEIELIDVLLSPVAGFKDRKKAYELAKKELKANNKTFLNYAKNKIKKDFNLIKIKELSPTIEDKFWAYVDEHAYLALE